jgi:hypothetical protein
MILRRVNQHVRNQEWTSIVLEIVIVVLGVFIGIQVSNWNTARLEANQGAVFTERLKADLRVEAFNYDMLIDYLGDVQASVDTVLAALEGTAEISDEQFLIDAFRATQWQGGVRQRATYDELTSTGSIGLISDLSLRNTAVMVYSTSIIEAASRDGSNEPYRVVFRKIVPVATQVALGEKCGDRFYAIGDYAIIGQQLNYDCDTSLTPAQIARAVEVLRTQPDLIEILRLRAMNVRTQIVNLSYNNQDIRDSLKAIADETP